MTLDREFSPFSRGRQAMSPRLRVSASPRLRHERRGFTALELLVAIGIIVLLAAILIPVVNQVRMRAYTATTEGEMQRIMTACINYYHDFNAYPGPLSNGMVVHTGAQTPSTVVITGPANFNQNQITSSENLVLGLIGLLSPGGAAAAPLTYTPPPPTHDVQSLNYNRPATYHYLDYVPEELTSGYMFAVPDGSAPLPASSMPPTDTQSSTDSSGSSPGTRGTPRVPTTISDSIVPEFQDHIPDPMPILYIRAYAGSPVQADANATGLVTTNYSTTPAQYDFTELLPYGFTEVNRPDFPLPTSGGGSPAYTDSTTKGALNYFMNPTVAGQPRGKDSFILISAGPPDTYTLNGQSVTLRLYGTKNNIIVTP